MHHSRRHVPWWLPVLVLVLAVLLVAWPASSAGRSSINAGCRVTDGRSVYALTIDQAANATTIAAVGKSLGLADHAVTIALATALQESRLENLAYGDRDSLGLFQQRPSQGWGTKAQVSTPRLAAASFYEHLAKVPGWETMPVTEAAQRVQFSAAPTAYAQWEAEARLVAEALTGEIPAGLSCHFEPPKVPTTATTAGPALRAALTDELGLPGPGDPVTTARGRAVADRKSVV